MVECLEHQTRDLKVACSISALRPLKQEVFLGRPWFNSLVMVENNQRELGIGNFRPIAFI